MTIFSNFFNDTIFPLGVLYPEHSQLTFVKPSSGWQWCGLLDNILGVRPIPHWTRYVHLNPLAPGRFFVLDFDENWWMCHELGVMRKIIKGIIEKENLLSSYLSFKKFQSFCRMYTTFLFINEFSYFWLLSVDCWLLSFCTRIRWSFFYIFIRFRVMSKIK